MSKLQLFKLILKLHPTFEALKKESKMKLSTNVILQIIATIGQGINQATPFLSSNGKFLAATGIGLLQLVTAVVAHYSTPSGEAIPKK